MDEKLQALRDRIPDMECKPGCGDCCGPHPCSDAEWDRIEDQRMATGQVCPYVTPDGCAIYDERPLVCRLFGTVDDPKWRCPHGCKPEGLKTLPADEGREILRSYFHAFFFEAVDIDAIRARVVKALKHPTNQGYQATLKRTAPRDMAALLGAIDVLKYELDHG